MNAPLVHRIVVRPSLDGHVFKIQLNKPAGSNRWNTVEAFTNLHRARRHFPEAAITPGVVARQKEIENRQHEFERTNLDTAACDHCGMIPSWPAHKGGA